MCPHVCEGGMDAAYRKPLEQYRFICVYVLLDSPPPPSSPLCAVSAVPRYSSGGAHWRAAPRITAKLQRTGLGLVLHPRAAGGFHQQLGHLRGRGVAAPVRPAQRRPHIPAAAELRPAVLRHALHPAIEPGRSIVVATVSPVLAWLSVMQLMPFQR